jgi:hypothetical protein
MVSVVNIAGPGSRLYVEEAEAEIVVPNPVATGFALAWVGPFGDGEAGLESDDWHMLWPTTIEYAVPLVMEGGTPPYNFEIITGHSTGEIVHSEGLLNGRPTYYSYYCVENPSAETVEVTIRGSDQAGATSDKTWTPVFASRDSGQFRFNDSSAGNDSNDGTFSSPKQNGFACGDFDNEDTEITPRHFFMQGEFDVGGLAGVDYDGSPANRIPLNANKPKLYASYGTGAIINGAGAYLKLDGGSAKMFHRLHFRDPMVVVDAPNPGDIRGVFIDGSSSDWARGGTFECTFQNVGDDGTTLGPDSDGSTNPAAIHYSAGGTGSRMVHVGDTFDRLQGMIGYQVYDATHLAIHGVTMLDSANGRLAHLKGGTLDYISIYGFDCSDGNDFLDAMVKAEWIADPVARTRFKFSWGIGVDDDQRAFWFQGGAGTEADDYTGTAIFRCNLRFDHIDIDGVNNGDLTFTRNKLQHSGSHTNGFREHGTANDMTVTLSNNDIGTADIVGTDGLAVGGVDESQGAEFTP